MNLKTVSCLTVVFALALSVCAYGAKDLEDVKHTDVPKVAFPETPKDGSPVSFEFLSMVGSGNGLRAKIRVFNHGDKDITALKMTLNYLDDKGEKLKDFPWTQFGSPVAAKKSHTDIEVGVFVPENTKMIEPIVSTVTFDDKSKWEKELITVSSSPAAPDGPPQDWDKLTLTSNYMSKQGLIYAFIDKGKTKQERFTFGDLRKYIDLGYLKDKNKTWTHQNERWVFKFESNLV